MFFRACDFCVGGVGKMGADSFLCLVRWPFVCSLVICSRVSSVGFFGVVLGVFRL